MRVTMKRFETENKVKTGMFSSKMTARTKQLIDASAILDYFAPLKSWLDEQKKVRRKDERKLTTVCINTLIEPKQS